MTIKCQNHQSVPTIIYLFQCLLYTSIGVTSTILVNKRTYIPVAMYTRKLQVQILASDALTGNQAKLCTGVSEPKFFFLTGSRFNILQSCPLPYAEHI